MIEILNKVIKTDKRYPGINDKKYIVVHQTGNTNKGANAEAHHKLQASGNARSASWHVTVDDTKAIQSIDYDVRCWHAGDGSHGIGNNQGIAVEICINSDGDYVKAIHNGAQAVKQLMDKFNIPINYVKQHNAFSGKNCPAQIRASVAGISWNDFLQLVKGVRDEIKPVKHVVQRGETFTSIAELYKMDVKTLMSYNAGVEPTLLRIGQAISLIPVQVKLPTVTPKPAPKRLKYPKAHNETSIVNFLVANSADSSFDARKKLATQFGIKGYKGTASQNLILLAKLKEYKV